jgi:alpha-ketoglutarate-dependent 2,4-dichlorophenoxyacetate dioxygenase
MTVTISPILPGFAGEVSGVHLAQPLTRDDVRAIEAGMDQFAVLAFYDQNITDDQQIGFSSNFGPLEKTAGDNVTYKGERRIDALIEDVSNLDENNKPLVREDRRRIFNLGNQLWHSDSSFRSVPSKYSILSGRVTVEKGGYTEFADMRAAYDKLDAAAKAEIEYLNCQHSWIFSRATLGLTEVNEAECSAFKPVQQPLVRTHPVTGRKSLYLSSHIGGIVGWPIHEARAFLYDLTEQALRASPIYRHAWRQYDLLMWDNRTTMHRVTRFDVAKMRDMRRTTVAGDGELPISVSDDPEKLRSGAPKMMENL